MAVGDWGLEVQDFLISARTFFFICLVHVWSPMASVSLSEVSGSSPGDSQLQGNQL